MVLKWSIQVLISLYDEVELEVTLDEMCGLVIDEQRRYHEVYV